MKLRLDNNNVIVEYCNYGDIECSIEFKGEIPDDFEANFKPSYYLLQDDEIVVNQNYEEPTISIPEPQPSEADKQVAQLTYQQMMTTQDVTTLQTQNAQMAYQLMMIQQGGKA